MTLSFSAEIVAERAYAATKGLPAFDAKDRFQVMLERVSADFEDYQAEVIKACRVRAGL